MATAAVVAQGTLVKRGDGGDPTEIFTDITNVVSVTAPSGSAQVIDVTNLSSTAKEKCIGLPDNGQMTLNINYDSTDAEQTGLRDDRDAGTSRNFEVVFSDASQAAFAGYVMEWSLDTQTDDVVKLTVTVEIDGAITWT